MARYDYFCVSCGIIEVEKGMTEPHPTICPVCGLNNLRRRFTPLRFSVYGDHLRTNREPLPAGKGTQIEQRSP